VDPDIIFTTEADEWWAEQLKALDRSHPHHVKYPLDNTYGMILHSRLPLVEPSVRKKRGGKNRRESQRKATIAAHQQGRTEIRCSIMPTSPRASMGSAIINIKTPIIRNAVIKIQWALVSMKSPIHHDFLSLLDSSDTRYK
jgi:hypothetical protein